MSVLGLDLGYTVKYNPLPSGKGLYLTVYPSSRPNTDTVSDAVYSSSYSTVKTIVIGTTIFKGQEWRYFSVFGSDLPDT